MRFSSSSSLLLALLGSSAPALVPAARIWSSDGSRASWDDSYIDAGTAGKVTEVDNVYYGTAPALKMEQRYQASYGGLYHAEVHHYEGYKRGDKLSYGFEFRLQSDWDFTPGVSFNLAQFIADFTDLGCEETWMPSTMVYLYGNQLTTRVKYGNGKQTYFRTWLAHLKIFLNSLERGHIRREGKIKKKEGKKR